MTTLSARALVSSAYFVTLIFGSIAASRVEAAEPYITAPPEFECGKPPVVVPNGVKSRYFPSDKCGVIFIAPPEQLKVEYPGQFSQIRPETCDSLHTLLSSLDDNRKNTAKLLDDIAQDRLTAAQIQEEKAKLTIGRKIANDALADSYITFGSKTAISLQQNWQRDIAAFKNENPKYDVRALPTVAGQITFDEKRNPDHLEILGVYENGAKAPWLEYTISGLEPIKADSTLLNESALPIFFPRTRTERAGFEVVEFNGAVTASVTMNEVGHCQYIRQDGQSPVVALTPTANYLFALKTRGEYRVEVDINYMMEALKTLRTTTSGTAHASAIADDFYNAETSQNIRVILDDDLANSLTGQDGLKESFTQTVLYDLAVQFLNAVTGTAGERRNIALPDVANVERHTTIQKSRRVCQRKKKWFGLSSSKRCWDQVYNVRVLQDTSQYQRAEATVRGAFQGVQSTELHRYILVPSQASL